MFVVAKRSEKKQKEAKRSKKKQKEYWDRIIGLAVGSCEQLGEESI